MVNERFSKAFKEVLHYFKGIRKKDIDKIPNKLKVFLEENASKDFECDFDYTKPLADLKISKEAKGIITIICLNYWCETEENKKDFLKLLNENEEKYQSLIREKYNPENIFKNDKGLDLNVNLESAEGLKNSTSLVKINNTLGNIFVLIFNKIKSFFNRNKIKKSKD